MNMIMPRLTFSIAPKIDLFRTSLPLRWDLQIPNCSSNAADLRVVGGSSDLFSTTPEPTFGGLSQLCSSRLLRLFFRRFTSRSSFLGASLPPTSANFLRSWSEEAFVTCWTLADSSIVGRKWRWKYRERIWK